MIPDLSPVFALDTSQPLRSGASLTKQVTDLIRRMIIEGELPLGSAISEMALADKFGISKSPVRSALKELAQEGLVSIYPQRGTYVFAPSREEWLHLCEFRRHLELYCFETAVMRSHDRLVDELKRIARNMRKSYEAQDAKKYIDEDVSFHISIVENSRNAFFSKAYGLIVAKVATILLYLGANWEQIDQSYAEHLEIADLLESGEDTRAFELFRKHMTHARDVYGLDSSSITAV